MRLIRLRQKLLEGAPARRPADPSSPGLIRSVERFAAGGERFPEELFGSPDRWDELARRLEPFGPLAFWDIETCGLGDAPIFLIGLLSWEGPPANGSRSWRLELLLAEDPSREPQLLRAASELLGRASCWVTFNGRCFDHPRLLKRTFRHGIPLPECGRHVDLLREVRRRWKGVLPDCRLSTVERRLLGLERGPGEVSGAEAPERYQLYVKSGDRRWIEPVLAHNRQDVLALALLFGRLLEAGL
ncbi:MAG: ribonuclease H-like domain-containing protein [Planctomycetes bacterium]|nr:ribonuclease H-like domain-containing protein [Planctomycetota bacterium]